MSTWPSLSLPEWTVLAVVNERPTHGFGIAQLFQARHLLALADACAARDQEKVEALSHPPLAIP